MSNSVNVSLVAISAQDLDYIFEWQKDVNLAQLRQARGIPSSLDDVKVWFNLVSKNRLIEIWMIAIDRHEAPVGYVRLDFVDSERKEAYIGILVAQNRNQGIGTEVLKKLMTFYSGSGLKLRARVSLENTASIRLFKKMQFSECEIGEKDSIVLERFVW